MTVTSSSPKNNSGNVPTQNLLHHQRRNGTDLHLLHDMRAVHFDRLLDRSEVVGDLLVQPTCDDRIEDLTLAWR